MQQQVTETDKQQKPPESVTGTAASSPPQKHQQSAQRPSSAKTHHQDGTFAQVKVFATPVSLPRPGSAPSFLGRKESAASTLALPQTISSPSSSLLPSFSSTNNKMMMMKGGAIISSSSKPKSRLAQSSSASNSISRSPLSHQQSLQQVKGNSHWEHWTHNQSPGRAAARAAKECDDVYSGQSRDEARDQMKHLRIVARGAASYIDAVTTESGGGGGGVVGGNRHRLPFPSSVLAADGKNRNLFIVKSLEPPLRSTGADRGGSVTDQRPSSSRSNTSSHNSGNETPRFYPSIDYNGAALPPRKIITAQLTALRRKYSQAHEANQKQQQQFRSNDGWPTSSSTSDPNARKIRSQLDNIMHQINSNQRGPGQGTKVVDLGVGTTATTTTTTTTNSPSRQNHRTSPRRHQSIPAHIQLDNIVRRSTETAQVMRREDQVARANDRRIRNFRARALVQTATEMQRAKRQQELKEINDKLVWAKMKRDAVDGELYDLKERLTMLQH